MKNVIVKTQDLKKYYKTGNQTVKALDGVDFKVAERCKFRFIGSPIPLATDQCFRS